MTTTTTTATRTTITTSDAKARSLELAAGHGQTSCSHAARTLGWTLDETTGALVSLALSIHSATRDTTTHAVGYRAAVDDAECECEAAAHHRGCWHRGLAILIGRSVAQLYLPARRAEAMRGYRLDQAAEANAAALGY